MSERRTLTPAPATEADKLIIEALFDEMFRKLQYLSADLPSKGDPEPDLPFIALWGTGHEYKKYQSTAHMLEDDSIKFQMVAYVRSKVSETQPEIVGTAMPAYARICDTKENVFKAERKEVVMMYIETLTGAVATSMTYVDRSGFKFKLSDREETTYGVEVIETTIGDFYDRTNSEW